MISEEIIKNLSNINIFALGPYLGPKMDPRWAQDGPKRAQDGPKDAQDGPKMPSKNKNAGYTHTYACVYICMYVYIYIYLFIYLFIHL